MSTKEFSPTSVSTCTIEDTLGRTISEQFQTLSIDDAVRSLKARPLHDLHFTIASDRARLFCFRAWPHLLSGQTMMEKEVRDNACHYLYEAATNSTFFLERSCVPPTW